MKHYNLDDIRIILNAFGLPQNGFTSRKDRSTDIYFKKINSPAEINLLSDTLEYVHTVLYSQRKFAPNRRVAYLFETTQGPCAIIVWYGELSGLYLRNLQKLLAETRWLTTLPTVEEMSQSPYAEAFKSIYPYVSLACCTPIGVNLSAILPRDLYDLPFREHYMIWGEYSSVALTESILMHLFLDNTIPFDQLDLEKVFNCHRTQCEKKLVDWLKQLLEKSPNTHKKIMSVLTILIKLTLLQAQQNTLIALGTDEFLHRNEPLKKQIFAMPLGDIEKILPHLPFAGIIHILRFHHDVAELIQQLEIQRSAQEHDITDLERRVKEFVLAAQPQLSWSQWGQQKIWDVANYCYQRSPVALGSAIVPWLINEVTPLAVMNNMENFLQRILQLIRILFHFIPEHLRPANIQQPMPNNLVMIMATLMGGGLGAASLCYTSIFDTLLSLSLLFLTEHAHSFFSSQRTELHTARVISRLPFVPSVSTLLRMNVLFVSLLMGWYMGNMRHIKRSITTISASEIVRRWFIQMSRDMDLSPEEHHYFEYCFVQLGLQFGELIFHSYDTLSTKMIDREKIMQVLADSAREAGVVNVDVKFDTLLYPSRWIMSGDSCQLSWRSSPHNYITDCVIDNTMRNMDCGITSRTTLLEIK